MSIRTPDLGGGGGGSGVTPGLLVNQFFHRITAPSTTVAAPVPPFGFNVINVVDTTGFGLEDKLSIDGKVSSQYIPISDGPTSGTSLGLKYPLDNLLILGQTVERVETNIASLAGGGPGSPVVYQAKPVPTERWRIAQLLVTMTYGTEGFDGDFGNINNGLPFGSVFRFSIGGVFTTLMEWTINEDIQRDCFDFKYSSTRGATGVTFGLNARFDFARLTADSILDGANGDFLEYNMVGSATSLTNFQISALGQVVP